MTLSQPPLIAADFEGVFIPEIWIAVADCTGIPELRKTTRDISDYDKLMAYRLAILDRFGLTLTDIQAAISQMEPLPGAHSIMKWLRRKAQFIILTDSFYQFVASFAPKLGYPTIFAHQLATSRRGMITGYTLRVPDSKREAIAAFRSTAFAPWRSATLTTTPPCCWKQTAAYSIARRPTSSPTSPSCR